jgi:hypothetical protein
LFGSSAVSRSHGDGSQHRALVQQLRCNHPVLSVRSKRVEASSFGVAAGKKRIERLVGIFIVQCDEEQRYSTENQFHDDRMERNEAMMKIDCSFPKPKI